MDDRDAILRLLHDQDEATARGDAAGVVKPLADDVVSYDLPPPLENHGAGPEAEEAIDRWFATWENGVTVRLHDPTVLVDGDLAVVFELAHMQGIKLDKGPLDNWFRRTVALRRGQDGWRIVHDHSSFPMLMDGSGKAATYLTPESAQ